MLCRVHVAVALEPYALAEKRRRAAAAGAGDDEADGNAAPARLAFRRETGEWVSAGIQLPAVLQPWTLLSDGGANASLEAYHGPDAFRPSSVAAAGADTAAAASDASSHEVETAQYRSLGAEPPPTEVRTQSGAGTTAAAAGLAAAGVHAVAADGGLAAADIAVPTPDRRMVPHQDVAEAASGGGSEAALERSGVWRGLRGVFYCVPRAPAASAACGEAEEEDDAHRLPPADYSGWTFVLAEHVTPPMAAAASASVTPGKAQLRLRYVYGFASARAAAEARSQRRVARPADFEHDAEACALSVAEAASPSSGASEVAAATALPAARPAQPPPHSAYRTELLRRAASDELAPRPTARAAGKRRAGAGGVASLGAGASNALDDSEDEEAEQLRSAMAASCLSYEREQILRAQVVWTSNSGPSLEESHPPAPRLHSHPLSHPHPAPTSSAFTVAPPRRPRLRRPAPT